MPSAFFPATATTLYPNAPLQLMRALFIIDVRSREFYPSTAIWGEQVSRPFSRVLRNTVQILNSSLKVSCCVAQAVLRSTDCSAGRACCRPPSHATHFSACATCWMHGASLFATRNSPAIFSRAHDVFVCLALIADANFMSVMIPAAAAALMCSCRILQ